MSGADKIREEREKQKKTWTAEHDAEYERGELIRAAIFYLASALDQSSSSCLVCYVNNAHGEAERVFPWSESFQKDRGLEDALVVAGALVAAELDRMEHEPT